MKMPLHVRELNRAREWYNPLRGLDVQRVVYLLEEGERGKFDDLQKLNRMAEKRHPTLRALKHRRLAALSKLDWDIKIPSELPAGITAAQAEAQADFLRSRYEQIENLPDAIEFLALATFRGFSHLEPRHQDDDPSLPIVRLNPVPQWHWVRDQEDFSIWRYDADAKGNVTSSTPIDATQFIIREVDDPLCEIALLCFLRRNMGKKNWTVFQEDYALASIFATLGENTPTDKVPEWLELVKKVTNNSRGVLPPGSTVTPLELGNLDGVQFENFIKAEDSDLVLAGTSGLLTMLTADTGMNGDSQGDNHEETFAQLALAEAMVISALMQRQFDKPALAADFPSQPPVAYFELAAKDEEDVDALADRVAKFHGAGFRADPQEVSEKSGLKLTAAPEPAAPADPGGDPDNPPAEPERDPLKNRANPALVATGTEARFMANAERRLAAADRAILAPVVALVGPIRAELARLADEQDDAAFDAGMAALQPRLRQLQAQLPDLEEKVLGANPELDDAFSEIIGTALASGLAEGAEQRRRKPKKP